MVKFTARFEASAHALAQCPRWRRIEIAIAGRSNVGKSSMLNAFAGAKRLARTSATPGRTQSLNFFTVGNDLALVDLPGFGYARVPEKVAGEIAAMLSDYLTERENLRALILLVDSRRTPQAEELSLAAIARRRGLAVIVAATKCDKLKRSERAAALARLAALSHDALMCSAVSDEGIAELRRRVLSLAARADCSVRVPPRPES